jgi:uncharacterized protein YicC (UPF0701 family)
LVQFSESKTPEGGIHQAAWSLGKYRRRGFDVVKSHANAFEQMVKDTLLSRFNEMLGDQNYDETDFAGSGVMLVKYSVQEEIKRLGVHLKEYFSLLEKEEPTGKRLDFL